MLELIGNNDQSIGEHVSDDDSEDDSFLQPENLKHSSLVMLNQSNNDQTYNSTHRDDMTMANADNLHTSNVFFNNNDDNTMDLSMTTGANKTKSHVQGVPQRLPSNSGLANRSCVSKVSVFDPISTDGLESALIVPKIRYNQGSNKMHQSNPEEESVAEFNPARLTS